MSQVDKTMENVVLCQCMKCPTYSFACKLKAMPGNFIAMVSDVAKAVHLETMFCAFEPSQCIEQEKGCLCGQCEVHAAFHLHHGYYCRVTGGK